MLTAIESLLEGGDTGGRTSETIYNGDQVVKRRRRESHTYPDFHQAPSLNLREAALDDGRNGTGRDVIRPRLPS